MKYLVVGSPVRHSLSPAMMTAAFRALGLDATYTAQEIEAAAWPGMLADLHAAGVDGLNVTVPHKRRALASAALATDQAKTIGAANLLVRRRHGWLADNTDGPGFLDWVNELGRGELLAREATVLGAGGVARAVVWALLEEGCPRVRLANRTVERAREVAASFARYGEDRIEILRPADLAGEAGDERGLLVNCTALGLRDTDPLPLPEEALARAGCVLDLVYPETALVREARARGLRAEDGLGLLVAQGARSCEIWTGQLPDRGVLLAAARAELDRRAEDGEPRG